MAVLVTVLLGGCASTPFVSHDVAPSAYEQQAKKAFSLMNENHMKAAIPVLRQLASDFPGHAGPFINMGIAYRALGDLEQSMQSVQAALQISPESATALHQLGILYREQGKFADSKEAYEKALAIRPNYALAHRNIGILLDLYLQAPERALPHYQAYLRLLDSQDKEVSFWVTDIQRRLPARLETVSR